METRKNKRVKKQNAWIKDIKEKYQMLPKRFTTRELVDMIVPIKGTKNDRKKCHQAVCKYFETNPYVEKIKEHYSKGNRSAQWEKLDRPRKDIGEKLGAMNSGQGIREQIIKEKTKIVLEDTVKYYIKRVQELEEENKKLREILMEDL